MKNKTTETPIRPIEKVKLAFEELEERAGCVEGLGRQIVENIEELKTVLKEAGHVVPILPASPDRNIQLTREQAEELRNFWYAVGEIQSSALVSPKDLEGGESITLKLVLQTVGGVFESIDKQLGGAQ